MKGKGGREGKEGGGCACVYVCDRDGMWGGGE